MFRQAIENFKGDFIIRSDFNFPGLIWMDGCPYYSTANSPIKARPFIKSVHDLSAYQLVDQVKQFRPSQQSKILNLVFVNRFEAIQKVKYLPSVRKSSHLAIEIIASRHQVRSKSKKQVCTEYEVIIREQRLINWDELLQGDVNAQWEKFLTAVTVIQSRNRTQKLVPVPRTLPHTTPFIKRQTNRKLCHWKKRDEPGHYEKYIQTQNRLRNLTVPKFRLWTYQWMQEKPKKVLELSIQ